jgi:hypothetical protein
MKIALWVVLGAAVGACSVWMGRSRLHLPVPAVVGAPAAGLTGANAVRRKAMEPLRFRRVTARPVRR